MPVDEVSFVAGCEGAMVSTHASLGVIELYSTSESSLCQKTKLGDDKFVELEMAMPLAGL